MRVRSAWLLGLLLVLVVSGGLGLGGALHGVQVCGGEGLVLLGFRGGLGGGRGNGHLGGGGVGIGAGVIGRGLGLAGGCGGLGGLVGFCEGLFLGLCLRAQGSRCFLGRRRPLPELASSNFQVRSSGERMARNTPIQGTAADIIKLAMVHVWQRLRDEKLQARLLLQVHDELIVEAPENEVDQVKRILKEEMEQVVSYSVPLTAEVGTGKTWLEAH